MVYAWLYVTLLSRAITQPGSHGKEAVERDERNDKLLGGDGLQWFCLGPSGSL